MTKARVKKAARGKVPAALDYPAMVRRLDDEEGGGVLIEFPDLPGCIADGQTIDDALSNAASAVQEWIDAAREMGRTIPEPRSIEDYSGKWVQRVPKSLHMKLTIEARREGVSLNSLAMALLAEGLGKREAAE